MFRDRRRLRRWAAQVLLAWLFGIATGIAHACVLRLADPHHEVASVGQHEHESVASHAHDERSPDADDKANCLDFCEKSSVAAPSLKDRLDRGGDTQSLAVMPGPMPWMAGWIALTPACPRSPRVIAHGWPPPRIAFQRLAL
jgi:hypothetical protein